jgi:hypothetical protein
MDKNGFCSFFKNYFSIFTKMIQFLFP